MLFASVCGVDSLGFIIENSNPGDIFGVKILHLLNPPFIEFSLIKHLWNFAEGRRHFAVLSAGTNRLEVIIIKRSSHLEH